MVYVDVKSINENIVIALYHPERKDAEPGTITFDIKEQQMLGYDRSPVDKMTLDWYIGHAVMALKRMTSETPMRISGMSAWY